MKMGAKLGAAFGSVVLLLIILGVTSIVELNTINQGYGVEVKNKELAKAKAMGIVTDILQVRRSEKDFLARLDLKYPAQVNKSLDAAELKVKELLQSTDNPEIGSKLTSAQTDIGNYRQVFAKMVGAWEKKGLNEKLGLQGEFRTAAHQLEGFLQKNDTSAIRHWVLMLRRYEKDLNINHNNPAKAQKYQAKFQAAIESFHAAIADSHLDEGLKSRFDEAANAYQKAMSDWYTAVSAGQAADYNTVRNLVRQIEQDLAQHYVDRADVLYLTLRKHEKDYLLRGNSKYVERAHQTLAALANQTDASQLSSADQQKVKGLLASYKNSFDALVVMDGQIGSLLKEMKQRADRAMSGSEEVASISAATAEQRSAAISETAATATLVVWIVGAFSILFASILAYLFARSISVPMGKTVQMIEEMEKGHLDARLEFKRKDEIGQMAEAMNAFADSLQHEVVGSLQSLAEGDLTFSVTPRDNQDVIRGALQKVGADLNETMSQILVAGEQIASGGGQVSDAAQSLSQGATESAASLEQITSSMNEMASQTTQNAENASQANSLSAEAKQAAEKGNAQMQTMVSAMSEINEASQNISKIIKTIDEIAFQTNLLALNAAVEAARAGQHGKGFAVVAEEVRNLAARSAKAAEETAELIEGSVAKSENGTAIASQTAEALGEIVGGIGKVSDLVSEIAASSTEQADGIAQVDQGLTQIDQVTQQNTASAEESAAAAEELSGQANQLQHMLQRFKLNQTLGKELRQPATLIAKVGWSDIESQPQPTATPNLASSQITLDDNEFGKY